MAPTRRTFGLGRALAAGAGLWLLSQPLSFVSGPSRAVQRGELLTARRAEGENKPPEDMGFLRFLKVEQDITLTEEEYRVALEAEMDAQRKKYYIGGVIKAGNLLVPWKPVDEKQVEKDARRQLKKNGINDPSQKSAGDEETVLEVVRVGEQDVKLTWNGGQPGTKVGYIIERKKVGTTYYEEISTHDGLKNPALLVKSFSGFEYDYIDNIVPAGDWQYRLLLRMRSGEIVVVDEKSVNVPPLSGLDTVQALGFLAAVVVLQFIIFNMGDNPIQWQ